MKEIELKVIELTELMEYELRVQKKSHQHQKFRYGVQRER